MPSRRTNNFPESGRGLGHVTTRIFGSTVGYPSDSLASCYESGWVHPLRTEHINTLGSAYSDTAAVTSSSSRQSQYVKS